MVKRFFLLALALMLAAPAPALAIDFPRLTGRVVDQANLLSPEQEAQLDRRLEALQRASRRQLVIATIADLQGLPIEDYGYQLGRAWGIGQRGANNGVILIVAPNERRTRIEVGYGLEPIITDALSSQIIERQMIPRFRASPPDFGGGIMAGAEALIQQLQAPPEAAEQRTLAAQQDENRGRSRRGSGGGFPFGLIIGGVVFLFILVPLMLTGLRGRRYRGPWGRGGRVATWGRGSGRGGSGLGWMLAGMFLNSLASGRRRGGGWGGGGWGGGGGSGWGGGGGGGFSGGGGSFGGGGASGGW